MPVFSLIKDECKLLLYRNPKLKKAALTILTMFCFPCALLYFCSKIELCGTGRARRAMNRLLDMTVIKYEHDKRKRTLLRQRLPLLDESPSILSKLIHKRGTRKDQIDSALLTKLPLELRQRIWEYIVCDERAIDISWCRDRDKCAGGFSGLISHRWIIPDRRYVVGANDGILPLLRTCRQVYSEASTILFSKNHFHFHNMCPLRGYIAISPRASLERIRQLSLSFIDESLEERRRLVGILRSLKGLRGLYLYCPHHRLKFPELYTGSSPTFSTETYQSTYREIRAAVATQCRVFCLWDSESVQRRCVERRSDEQGSCSQEDLERSKPLPVVYELTLEPLGALVLFNDFPFKMSAYGRVLAN